MYAQGSLFGIMRRLCQVIPRDPDFCPYLTAMIDTFSCITPFSSGLRQANLVLIAYASSEGSGEPAHSRSLARTFAARSYKQ